MTGRTDAQHLAAFAVEAAGALPDDVAASVRQRILDVLGLAAAATPLDTSRGALAFVSEQADGGAAHAIGLGRTSPAWAAFANGVLAHSLDYDDTHLPSILHPSAPVVPAALAAAEATGADGAALTAAVAVGLEICVRIGMVGYDRDAGNSTFFEHGQHATSICGAIGGAAAAALLYEGTEEAVCHAMGVAASMASGIIEANRTGGTVKRLHAGWAAHAAVSAAQLVRHGFTGPPTVLEGRFGLFEAFLHGPGSPAEITDGLGVDWAVPGIFFKPYPANHFTHTTIDAALRLRAAGVAPSDVERVHVAVAGPTVRTVGEPLEAKQRPETGYQAQFSAPYVVAAVLHGGGGLGLGLDDFTDELARDPARRELMARVDVGSDPRCDEVFPHQFPAIVTARLRDGRQLVEQVMANRGGPANPLTDDELATKFRDNALRLVDPATAEEVARATRDLAGCRDVAGIVEPLAVPLGATV